MLGVHLFLILLLAALIVVATHPGNGNVPAPRTASVSSSGQYQLALHTAIRDLLPGVEKAREGIEALNKGNLNESETNLADAVPTVLTAQARVDALHPPPSFQGTHALLKHGIALFVAALQQMRDAVQKGNVSAAIAASSQVLDGQTDILLATNGGLKYPAGREL